LTRALKRAKASLRLGGEYFVGDLDDVPFYNLTYLGGQALLARIDVGFSEEESALVYLSFNHPF
jgi:hypothetical protein